MSLPLLHRGTKVSFALAAILVYSFARGQETEHYKIKQPIRQKSSLLHRGRNLPCPSLSRAALVSITSLFHRGQLREICKS